MGNKGSKKSVKGVSASGVSVTVVGLVTKNGKTAVKLKVAGKTILVPAGGSESRSTAADVLRRVRSVGDKLVATISPGAGGKLKVGISGTGGAITFSGTLA